MYIGVMGPAGHGKDTVGRAVIKAASGYERRAFADKLKEMFCRDLGVGADWLEDWKRRDDVPVGWSSPVRKSLEAYGNAFRVAREHYWIDACLGPRDGAKRRYVVTDVRFVNEANEIKARGGLLVYVAKPTWSPPSKPTSSEALACLIYQELLGGGSEYSSLIDFNIWNGGTVAALDFQVAEFLQAKGLA